MAFNGPLQLKIDRVFYQVILTTETEDIVSHVLTALTRWQVLRSYFKFYGGPPYVFGSSRNQEFMEGVTCGYFWVFKLPNEQ